MHNHYLLLNFIQTTLGTTHQVTTKHPHPPTQAPPPPRPIYLSITGVVYLEPLPKPSHLSCYDVLAGRIRLKTDLDILGLVNLAIVNPV